MKPIAVLDTGAILAFTVGADPVGQLLVDAADAGAAVAIPSTCLLEAYAALNHGPEHDLITMLRSHPTVRVDHPLIGPAGRQAAGRVPVMAGDDLPFIAGMGRRAGRLGAGHATVVALTNAAAVYTSHPDQIRKVLPEAWVVVEV